jgi:hypothetical protein
MTSSNLNRFTKVLVLGAFVAGAAAPAAGAVGRPPNISDSASSLAGSYVGSPPDVRDAAAHLTVPDAFERYTASHPYGKGVSSPQQVGIPFYTPEMLAAHFDREARLYQPRPAVPAVSDTAVSNGFDWSDWAIGLGSGIGLILALGGAFAISRQWLHRVQTA